MVNTETRQSEEYEISSWLDSLRSKVVHQLSAPKLCKVSFRTSVNTDYMLDVQNLTNWRIVMVGEKELLLVDTGETPASVNALIELSREYHNCCRTLKLNSTRRYVQNT